MSSLNSLLDRAQNFAPNYYERHLSNHLPMALVAMRVLGANEAQMERGVVRFSQKLEPAAQAPEPCADWTHWRGQREAFAAVRAHFVRDILEHGADAALRTALPYLIGGAGGAAFHGLLRTASAVVARHDGEVASGLAHWACSYMPLVGSFHPSAAKVTVSQSNKLELHAWLSKITSTPASWKSPDDMIASLMRNYSESESFQTTAPRLQVHDGTLRDLATIALEHYLRSRNFTVLHLVTGAHATRILLPYSDDPQMAVRHYAVAFAAGVAASGIDPDAAALPVTVQPWEALIAAACNAEDEHEIKLIYVCHEEFLVTEDDRYRSAASLVLCRN